MTPSLIPSRDGLTIEGYLTLPKGYTMETAKKAAGSGESSRGSMGTRHLGDITLKYSSLPHAVMPYCK